MRIRIPDAIFVGGSGNADFIGQAAGGMYGVITLTHSITITHQGGRRRRFSSMVFSIGNVTLPRLQVTN